MSVFFGAPQAPTKQVPCWMCADTKRWQSDPAAKCYPTCGGVMEESTLPEVNFSNHNARRILALMGCDPNDLCGELQPKEIPAVLQRLLTVINVESQREHLVEDARIESGSRGPTVVWGGNTDAQTLRRLFAIQQLLAEAAEGGFGISWG